MYPTGLPFTISHRKWDLPFNGNITRHSLRNHNKIRNIQGHNQIQKMIYFHTNTASKGILTRTVFSPLFKDAALSSNGEGVINGPNGSATHCVH